MYATDAELPDHVRRALPDAERAMWRETYNLTGSMEQAWAAVERSENVRFFECWASLQTKDLQGEMMSVDGLAEAMPTYLAKGGPIYFGHKAAEIGTAFRGQADIHPERHIPAIRLKAAHYRDSKFCDDAWDSIKKGEFRDVSIGGNALRQMWKCDNESCYNFVEKMDWFDTSIVRNGAVPGAEIFGVNMKAKELKKCPKCKEVTMTDTPPAEGIKEPAAPSEAEMVTKGVDDAQAIDGLLQKIMAMLAQFGKKLDDVMQMQTAPDAQAIEENVDGQPAPTPEGEAEGEPAQETPAPAEGEDMDKKEAKPEPEPQEAEAEKDPVQAEAEDKVEKIKEMKAKAEMSASTPRPGMAEQPDTMFAKREMDWSNPEFLRSIGKTSMRDLLRGKFKDL